MRILPTKNYILHCYFSSLISMPRRYVNAVYFPSWKIYQDKTPDTLDALAITHIFYAFIGYDYRQIFGKFLLNMSAE